MERQKYIIDTNAVIDYLGNKMPAFGMSLINNVLDTNPNISVITKIEVLSFNTIKEDYEILENFVNDVNLIDLNDAIIERTIKIRKTHKVKLPDAIIAATAIEYSFTLITRNFADFKFINRIKLINPYKLIV
ncbi:type II toxin-antitoxin system VapC family toxin [bacterium]|nr:MAG: type II toxin-antitoxin system VapC family toxin [bacterium]